VNIANYTIHFRLHCKHHFPPATSTRNNGVQSEGNYQKSGTSDIRSGVITW